MGRLIRTTAVLAGVVVVIVGAALGVAAFARSSPRLASAHASSSRTVPRSGFGLSRAPTGLQAAVRGTLGENGLGGGWSQQAELTAANGAESDSFGGAVAIDGATAVVGAADKNSRTGAVYVFVRTGKTWSQQAELTAADGADGDTFGVAVAISGRTVLVGARGKNSGTGAAYVFVRTGKTWSQQAELTAANGADGDSAGESVAISGNTALVGAPGKNSGTGAAYVFVRTGQTWSQQAELTAADGAEGDVFGNFGGVAISGNTALVGAPLTSLDRGAAYVFVRTGKTWSQQTELTATDDGPGARFGWAVAISGTTVVVGAPYKNNQTGAAYVFVRTGKTWSQQAELTTGPENTRRFGETAAISGNTVVVGEPFKFFPVDVGAAFVFARTGKAWSREAELGLSDGRRFDFFASSVGISGTTVVVGASGRSEGTGAAYVFVRLRGLPVTG